MKRLLWVLLLITLGCQAQSYNQDIIPGSSGLNLGHTNQRWNANLQNLDISGTCSYRGTPVSCIGSGGSSSNFFNQAVTITGGLNLQRIPLPSSFNCTINGIATTCTMVPGSIEIASNAANTSDCTIGGGSSYSLCVWSGSAWSPLGGAGGGGGSVAWGAITGTLSSQTDLQNALNLLAPLASPTFTGTPTAPTPATNDNSTAVATTAYVKAQTSTEGATFVGNKTIQGNLHVTADTTLDGQLTVAGVYNIDSTVPASACSSSALGSRICVDSDGRMKVSENSGNVTELQKINCNTWFSPITSGSASTGQIATNNKGTFYGFVIPEGCSYTTTQVVYFVGTQDNTANNYDIGIRDSGGNLKVHLGTTAGTTFSPTASTKMTLSWTGGGATLTAGTYYFETTSNCTSSCATLAGAGLVANFVAATAVSEATGGVMASTLSPPASAATLTNQIQFVIK